MSASRIADALSRLLDGLVRLLGGDPRRVRALATGLRRATAGRMALIEERRETGIPLELVPVLVAMALALTSLGITAGVALMHDKPQLATLAVAIAHAAMAITMTAMLGAPSLLAEDDAAVVGWWPLSARDLTLARILIVLRPVMQGTVVLCALPLVAHAIAGPIPVVSALGLAIGIVLQAVAATGAVMAVVAGAVRLLGRTTARRVLFTVAFALGLAFLGFEFLAIDATGSSIERIEPILAVLPPAWFAAWGTIGARGLPAIAPMALSLICALAIIPAALRALAPSSRVERRSLRQARPRPAPLAWLAGLLLRPMTRTREGRAIRLLVIAHLREEWRLALLAWTWPIGAIVASAVLLVPHHAIDAVMRETLHAPFPLRPAFGPIIGCLFAALPGTLLLLSSESHRASWLLALSDLAPERVLAATRDVARVLVLGPALVVVAALAIRLHVPWHVALADALVGFLVFDIALRALQSRFLVWPFSRPWEGPPDLLVIAMLAGAVPLGFTLLLALGLAYDRGPVARALSCLALATMAFALHRETRRACRERGLKLELAN